MADSREQRLQQAIDTIRHLPEKDREKILSAVQSLRGLPPEELKNLTAHEVFAACGPCSPCGPAGEIGIESGY